MAVYFGNSVDTRMLQEPAISRGNLNRFAGVSGAGACCRNHERSEGPQTLVGPPGFELEALSRRERSGSLLPKS
jgi:hypothetical protein